LTIRNSNVNREVDENLIFILDLDYYSTIKLKNDIELLNGWLHNAHEILNKSFEGSMEDKLLAKFE